MSLLSRIFRTRTLEEYTQSLANYLPGGKLFLAKNVKNSNTRKLLRGLSGLLFNVNGDIKTFADEIVPNKTTKFLKEWEQVVDLPDATFTTPRSSVSIQGRRNEIVAKLGYMGCQTIEDMHELLELLKFFDIEIYAGMDDPTGVTNGLTDRAKRFTIVVDASLVNDGTSLRFPFTFPALFGEFSPTKLQNIFDRIIPSNCQVLYTYGV